MSSVHESFGNNVALPWDIVFKWPISVYVIDAIDELEPIMFHPAMFHYAIWKWEKKNINRILRNVDII